MCITCVLHMYSNINVCFCVYYTSNSYACTACLFTHEKLRENQMIVACGTHNEEYDPGTSNIWLSFDAMVLILSDLQISYIEVFFGIEKAYHVVKKHTTWSWGMSLSTT